MRRALAVLLFAACFAASAQAPAPRLEASGEATAGATRPANDDTLTQRVEETLRRVPGLDPSDVRVRVYAGTVQLMGWVDHGVQREQAAQAVRTVPGVQQVQNSLEVK